ncbi:MAG TPA: o-succinylbenzoate synthase [Candidatus Limnocylindrales bacterium]|nr:o-succinylbenzoate synthase [Candidatus Limnocylindrales bacterium]
MRLHSLTLREIHLKLVAPFETSMDRVADRRIILAEVNVDGVSGWGECTAGEAPFYSPEDTDTCWHILKNYLWPMLKGKELQSAADVWPLIEPVRGHNMAKATVESAVWDAEAKLKQTPLWKLIGGELTELPCGVSIGLKDSLDELSGAVQKEVAAGYQRIKIKIKPGRDLALVQRIRQDFPRVKLMVDANSAYRKDDWPLLKQLDSFHLMMIEQPLGWDDLFGHVEVQKGLQTPICLDECIHTYEQAEAAIAIGACKIINIKLGRVGGMLQAKRIHDLCRRHSIPVWCGGMLESGIGRAQNIAMSTLPNFSLPGDVTASRRYWHEDIISPEVTVTPQGTIQVPSGHGIGFTPRLDRIASITVRQDHLT